jgi:hypothetical protein
MLQAGCSKNAGGIGLGSKGKRQALHSTRFLNVHQILQQKYPLFSKLSVIFEN